MASHQRSDGGNWLQSRGGLVLLGFLVIAAFFLVTEHTAHVFGALPFLLLALCPLMHVFMHGGHGGAHADHGDEHKGDGEGRVSRDEKSPR